MEIILNNTRCNVQSGISGTQLIAERAELKNRSAEIVGLRINGKSRDVSTPLQNGDTVETLTFNDADGQYMFWHTSAHVLAQAILRHYPDARPTIGPPIESGFYYDFADLIFSEEDFEKIEREIDNILKENYLTERIDYRDKSEALKIFQSNPYKKELIESFDEGLSAYRQGEFLDLCRGPHIPSVGMIKAFKILKTSGAYWRADQKNAQLTRIYAVSFPDKKLLREYIFKAEEAKKRDHRILGKKLDLFSFQTYAPGMPFFHPAGLNIWKSLMSFWYEKHREAGYEEIKTPLMMTRDLWETSGHWANYRENMYTTSIDEHDYAIKPMNCPGCMLFFKSGQYSYRRLPLRVAEVGNVHRHELSGALSGLFRVRSFHQDDSHLFMREQDIESEIIGILNLSKEIYGAFGLSYAVELSTRPAKSIGTDAQWEIATNGLLNALKNNNIEYKLNEGDGAFYGPKIDLHIKDAIGRTWQCGTIQLDMMFPEKFDLTYDDEDGQKKRPVMLHRTILGSIERFLGILIEHYAGRFPLWISPRQAAVVSVSDRNSLYAEEIVRELQNAGFKAESDTGADSMGKKIRNAQTMQYNYMITVGDRECEEKKLALRTRNGKIVEGLPLTEIISALNSEVSSRSDTSAFDK